MPMLIETPHQYRSIFEQSNEQRPDCSQLTAASLKNSTGAAPDGNVHTIHTEKNNTAGAFRRRILIRIAWIAMYVREERDYIVIELRILWMSRGKVSVGIVAKLG